MVKQECQSAILSPQVFEPSEFEKGMLTSKDNEIRNADVPEDFKSVVKATTGYYFCKRFDNLHVINARSRKNQNSNLWQGLKKVLSGSLGQVDLDQFRFLRTAHLPTPTLSQHFALSKK